MYAGDRWRGEVRRVHHDELPGAVIGAARAYGVDFDKCLNDRGRSSFATIEGRSLVEFLSVDPGLTWSDVVKPEYRDPLGPVR